MTRQTGDMDMQLFRKVVDDCKTVGINNIYLFNFGESLMHPHVFEAIDYVISKEFEAVIISTNGLMLNKEVSDRLIESGIDIINLSINAFSKETYQKICNPDFEKVQKNCLYLVEQKKKLNRKKPLLIAQMVVIKDNINEFPQFNQFWRDKVDQVNFIHYEEFDFDKKLTVDGMNIPPERHYCNRLKRKECYVLWNGDMTICSNDYDGKLVGGNVNNRDILEVFNSDAFNQLRALHHKKRWNEKAICKTCNEWQW